MGYKGSWSRVRNIDRWNKNYDSIRWPSKRMKKQMKKARKRSVVRASGGSDAT